MDTTFDVETRWPDLFDGLTAEQRSTVIDTLASAWHEGHVPERERVEILVAFTRGDIDAAESARRTASFRARRRAGADRHAS
ncbi:MAG: hypothetical protein ACRDPS_16760 [Nocardioides sp.]|uniref:antitoxin VbhA family protein n=1 Tax=Nocardioides sp. TaxID=35761 RepID=UPI003D6C48C3